MVAKLVASLDKAQGNLIAALVKEQEAQLNQPIITQYPRWMNDVEEVMAVAEAIIGAKDEEAEGEEFSEEVKLEPTYESGYVVLSSHPEIEAEGMKFSEEVNKLCTTDYVQLLSLIHI